MFCPECEGRINRSHTHGFNEKLIKAFTPYKAYRCRECDWRGWLTANPSSIQAVNRQNTRRTIIGFLATLLILIIALYIAMLV